MDFLQIMQSNLKNKGLSDSSIKLYTKNLSKLNDGLPLKNFKFLENVDEVMTKINHLKPTTRKSYLTCIVSILNTYKDNKKLTKICDKYYTHMNEAVKQLKETPTDVMSKTQSENWIDWNDILEIRNNIHTTVMKFVNNKELSLNQYSQLLNLVVLSLYVLTPPRRNQDYALMNIVKTKENANDKTINYLILDEKTFDFNVYKTAKHNEDTVINIPEDLYHVIEMYIKHHPLLKNGKVNKTTDIVFLVNHSGEPLKAVNSITRILNKIFGRKIGVSMLRHSYLTYKYGNEVKEMKDDAEKMGHSVQTQKDYIKDKKLTVKFE